MDASERLYLTLTFIIRPTSIVICTFIGISLYCSFRKPNAPAMQSSVVRINYLCIISFIVHNALTVFKAAYIDDTQQTFTPILNTMIGSLWGIAQLFIYVLLLLRLRHAFRGTKYQISRQTYGAFMLLFILYVIASSLLIIQDILTDIDEQRGTATYYHWRMDLYGVYSISVELIDLLISVVLISLFIHKMIQVTVDLHSDKLDVHVNDEIARLNEHQTVLLDVTAKYTILSFVATIWTQLTTFWLLAGWVTSLLGESEAMDMAMYDIFISFVTLDTIINPICLYLLFEVNQEKYQRCCRGCHLWARLCFRRGAQKRIRKQYERADWSSSDLQLPFVSTPSHQT